MIFQSVRQLKDVIKNEEKKLGLPSNTLLNYYMMERFLCRVSKSQYADVIIPKEVDYGYFLLFGNEKIWIKAYPLLTILAEKIESILARNVSNTRARDFYDVYILSKKNPDLNKEQLWEALYQKAEERKTMIYLENSYTYLNDIEKSKELQEIWENYRKKIFMPKI